MWAKEYLSRIKTQEAKISNLKNEIEYLKGLLTSLGSAGEGERVQASRNIDKFGSFFAKIDEKERQVIDELDSLLVFRLTVTTEINKLKDSRFIDVLYKRYVKLLDFEQIADEMCYNLRYIHKLHGQALMEFERVNERNKKA